MSSKISGHMYVHFKTAIMRHTFLKVVMSGLSTSGRYTEESRFAANATTVFFRLTSSKSIIRRNIGLLLPPKVNSRLWSEDRKERLNLYKNALFVTRSMSHKNYGVILDGT